MESVFKFFSLSRKSAAAADNFLVSMCAATANFAGKPPVEVLLALKAEPKLIGYLNQWRQNPTYQGCDKGWRSRLDYLRLQW